MRTHSSKDQNSVSHTIYKQRVQIWLAKSGDTFYLESSVLANKKTNNQETKGNESVYGQGSFS